MTVSARPTLRFALLAPFLVLGALWSTTASAQSATPLPDYVTEEFGTPPAIPDGPLTETVQAAVRMAFINSVEQSTWGRDQSVALSEIAASGDPRLAWIIADLMRFASGRALHAELTLAASAVLQIDVPQQNQWGIITDHLIAWDIPAPPDYLTAKRAIFTNMVPGWDRIFVEGDIDWRMVSWGGVLIDDRPFGTTHQPCNCIPAADNPLVSSAADATWLDDDAIVFGVEVNGETRAYPAASWRCARW